MNKFFLVALFVLTSTFASAQIKLFEDSLIMLGSKMDRAEDDAERSSAAYRFIPLLVKALKEPNSFAYKFDSLKSVKIIYSPDGLFRIFTWFIRTSPRSLRFFGAIQMSQPGPLKLFPLIDGTQNAKDPNTSQYPATNWYGAEYYQILPKDEAGNYVLLGWKGISEKVSARLVEVLSFREGKPVFGVPLFQIKNKVQNRLIFIYTSQASMMLKFEPAANRIVMDHLSPPDSTARGNYELYGPDFTYDVLRRAGRLWKKEENVLLSNEKTSKDASFIQPAPPFK